MSPVTRRGIWRRKMKPYGGPDLEDGGCRLRTKKRVPEAAELTPTVGCRSITLIAFFPVSLGLVGRRQGALEGPLVG